MRVLITGAAGMIGSKLAAWIAADGHVGGVMVSAMHLTDVVEPPKPKADFLVTARAADFSAPDEAPHLASLKPDLVFHLAAIVSGEAEADFEKGYRINFDGTRALLDALRLTGEKPKIVFASSIAVFGGPYPDIIPDDFTPQPLTSYGTQKLMGELLISDFSRKGFIDGVALRLPTICVRPGAPNKAASGFFSSIIREPLAGKTAKLPVGIDVVHTHASPRSAIGFLLHAAAMDLSVLGAQRAITLPGVGVSVGEQIDALDRIAGSEISSRIVPEPDEAVAKIVSGWPTRFESKRGRDLGFEAETSFDDIIQAHIDDVHKGILPSMTKH
jgi:D-erythronate 2-dehydrogenase